MGVMMITDGDYRWGDFTIFIFKTSFCRIFLYFEEINPHFLSGFNSHTLLLRLS